MFVIGTSWWPEASLQVRNKLSTPTTTNADEIVSPFYSKMGQTIGSPQQVELTNERGGEKMGQQLTHTNERKPGPLQIIRYWFSVRQCLSPTRWITDHSRSQTRDVKGAVSWDRFQKLKKKFTELGLTQGRGWFLKFLGSSDDFIMQKVYVLRLMPDCIGLIMVGCLFCQSPSYKWGIIEQGWM